MWLLDMSSSPCGCLYCVSSFSSVLYTALILSLRLQANSLTNPWVSLLKYIVVSARRDHNHRLRYTRVSDCLLEVQANCSGCISKWFSCQIHKKKSFRLIPLHNFGYFLPSKWLPIGCGGLFFTFHSFWKSLFIGNVLMGCSRLPHSNVVGFYSLIFLI